MTTKEATGVPTAMTISPDLFSRVAYADGVAGLQVSNGVAHFDLYQYLPGQPKDGGAAPRVVTQRLVLPISAIPELMAVLKGLDEKVRSLQQTG